MGTLGRFGETRSEYLEALRRPPPIATEPSGSPLRRPPPITTEPSATHAENDDEARNARTRQRPSRCLARESNSPACSTGKPRHRSGRKDVGSLRHDLP